MIKLKAPAGKYRIICVDTFDGMHWVYGDFDAKDDAISLAAKKGANMLKTHVYDDAGKHLADFGTF